METTPTVLPEAIQQHLAQCREEADRSVYIGLGWSSEYAKITVYVRPGTAQMGDDDADYIDARVNIAEGLYAIAQRLKQWYPDDLVDRCLWQAACGEVEGCA